MKFLSNVNSRQFRFILVGGLNTLFGLAVYSVLALTILPTWLVLIIANVITITFNFFSTGKFVFQTLKKTHLYKFIFTYVALFTLNLILIELLTPIVGGRIIAMFCIIIPISVLTYILQSKYVFK